MYMYLYLDIDICIYILYCMYIYILYIFIYWSVNGLMKAIVCRRNLQEDRFVSHAAPPKMLLLVYICFFDPLFTRCVLHHQVLNHSLRIQECPKKGISPIQSYDLGIGLSA